MKKTSRDRTDIFYNSKCKPSTLKTKNITVAIILVLVLAFCAYQYGYYIAAAANLK